MFQILRPYLVSIRTRVKKKLHNIRNCHIQRSMDHAPQSIGFQKVDLLKVGDEIRAENVGTRLDHVQNGVLDRNHSWVHASHVELVSLIEDIFQVQNFLRVVIRSQKRVMIATAKRQLLARNIVSSDLVVGMT